MNRNLCFVRNDTLGQTFISDLRKIFVDSGWNIKLYGRNANRKQFYPEKNRTRVNEDGSTWTWRSRFQQDFPVKFSTHVSIYLVKGRGKKVGLTYEMALGMFTAIKRAYLMNNVNPFYDKK